MLSISTVGVSLRVLKAHKKTFTCTPGLFVLFVETDYPRRGGNELDVIRFVSQIVDISNIIYGQQNYSTETRTEDDVENGRTSSSFSS